MYTQNRIESIKNQSAECSQTFVGLVILIDFITGFSKHMFGKLRLVLDRKIWNKGKRGKTSGKCKKGAKEKENSVPYKTQEQ